LSFGRGFSRPLKKGPEEKLEEREFLKAPGVRGSELFMRIPAAGGE
jgi:hypothetical protein